MSAKPRTLFPLAALVVTSAIASEQAIKPLVQYSPVSIIQLIAVPERYHSKAVFVDGYLDVLDNDMCRIYSSRDFMEAHSSENAIRFRCPEPTKELVLSKGSLVSVTGVFSFMHSGDQTLGIPTFRSVTSIDVHGGSVYPTVDDDHLLTDLINKDKEKQDVDKINRP